MNQVVISGRMVKDAEIRYNSGNQTAVGRFTIACDRPPKNGEKQADFINCVAFGRTAENMERFTGKGLRVAVVGRIQTGKFTNKDGQTVHTTDVIADRVEFIDWKESNAQNSNESVPTGFAAVPDDEFMPFA